MPRLPLSWGAAMATLGIPTGSQEAMQYVPMMALFAGLWLLLFYFLRAGRMVDFISTPVMGGFISGIAVTIVLNADSEGSGKRLWLRRTSGTA